jgi:hypothetical protein
MYTPEFEALLATARAKIDAGELPPTSGMAHEQHLDTWESKHCSHCTLCGEPFRREDDLGYWWRLDWSPTAKPGPSWPNMAGPLPKPELHPMCHAAWDVIVWEMTRQGAT